MNRREFIQLSALLPTLGLAPSIFAANKSAPILLLVELKGANDALNTLIPVQDPSYFKLRPKLAIKAQNSLPIGEGFAMHSALKPLLPEWQAGHLAWIHGLGYANPNRSHFRSIEIWETASDSDEYNTEGWISKLYPQKTNQLQGVVVGSDEGPLAGDNFNKMVMEDSKSFAALTRRLKEVRSQTNNSALARVLDVQNNVHQNARTVIDTLKHTNKTTATFPKGKFSKQLEEAAQLINNGLGASIYKVELSGFDTHRAQANKHNNLLSQLAQGLAAFSQSMKQSGQWNNVMIMTYSEFGRRAEENKSGGTDHGAAAAHFVMGGRVRGGFHGTAPRLDQLDKRGDIVFTSDYRSLYHTVASQWLRTNSPWSQYQPFQLIHS